ncbi:DUF4249 family protein [Flagellimonas allohymeniacidonis]|uniref:DUF4249 domain-containing protein n=1 Tax=Flagellimonas allohymeniacidonis TaxID=2517819 RepID=A0A4Q8QF24_9FLAO|nr:DUF4249 family protein [Allomuricauda hymeniacidonis]TAI49102.1 DUF4249 domain-containing protein [Allomuricauda hymeniacidonis]
MKKMFGMVLLLFLTSSCEDVVEVDVPSENPRLIVNALIRVNPDSQTFTYRVKVSLTDSFFGEIPVTNLTQITIGGAILVDINNPGSGIYEATRSTESLLPDQQLILQLTWEDRRYFAWTNYSPSVPIDDLQIGDGTLFDEDDTEVIVTFTDDPDRANFYVFDFGFGNFATTDDEFIQGQQQTFSYFYDENLESGDELTVKILGADQEFFNYMNSLIEQTEDDFGVFETPAATIRGNIFDVTDLDNIDVFDNVEQPELFPLGFFAVVEEYQRTITIP